MSFSIRNRAGPSSAVGPSRSDHIIDLDNDSDSSTGLPSLESIIANTPSKETKSQQSKNNGMRVPSRNPAVDSSSTDDIDFIDQTTKEKGFAFTTTSQRVMTIGPHTLVTRRGNPGQQASSSRHATLLTTSNESSNLNASTGTRQAPIEMVDSSPEPELRKPMKSSAPNKPTHSSELQGPQSGRRNVRPVKRRRVESLPDDPAPFPPPIPQSNHLAPTPPDLPSRPHRPPPNLPTAGGGPIHRGQRVPNLRVRRGKWPLNKASSHPGRPLGHPGRVRDVEMEDDTSDSFDAEPAASSSQSQPIVTKAARPTWKYYVPPIEESDNASEQSSPPASTRFSQPTRLDVSANMSGRPNGPAEFTFPDEAQESFAPPPVQETTLSRRHFKGKGKERIMPYLPGLSLNTVLPEPTSSGLSGNADLSEEDQLAEEPHAPPSSLPTSSLVRTISSSVLSQDNVVVRMSIPPVSKPIGEIQPASLPTFENVAASQPAAPLLAPTSEAQDDVPMKNTDQTTVTLDVVASATQSAVTNTSPSHLQPSFRRERQHLAPPSIPTLKTRQTARATAAVQEETSFAEPKIPPAERISFWKSQARVQGSSSPELNALLNAHSESTNNSDVDPAAPSHDEEHAREQPMDSIVYPIVKGTLHPDWDSWQNAVEIPCNPAQTERDEALLKDFDRLSFVRFKNPVVNELNKMVADSTNIGMAKKVMEAYINRARGAERAPPIDIDQSSSGEIPTPEYIYSNSIKYDVDTAPKKSAKGCDCIGRCSENSNCFCLKRQELYYTYDGDNEPAQRGFACTENGLVRDWQFPVWECGDDCECPPSCRNRVMQKGRSATADVQIFKTRQKGWGVRAKRDMPLGTFLGIYAGELIKEQAAEVRGAIYNVVGRTYLFDIDGWHIRHPPAGLAQLDPELYDDALKAVEELRLGGLQKALESKAKQEAETHVGNGKEETGDENEDDDDEGGRSIYTVDAFHWGNFTRYINHSCDPNLVLGFVYYDDYDVRKPKLSITTRRPVRKGEELTISYSGIDDDFDEADMESAKAGGTPLKTPNKSKSRASKVTATSHVESTPGGQANLPKICYCKAKNCRGVMFI